MIILVATEGLKVLSQPSLLKNRVQGKVRKRRLVCVASTMGVCVCAFVTVHEFACM